jgi:hypothetical protein
MVLLKEGVQFGLPEWLDSAMPSGCESRCRQGGRLLTGRPQACIVTNELVAYRGIVRSVDQREG